MYPQEEFLLDPAVVRRNDTSALSIDEWTGVKKLRDEDIPDDIQPQSIQPVGGVWVRLMGAFSTGQVLSYGDCGLGWGSGKPAG